MRAVGATEIAEDREKLDTTLSLFETIEQTATPTQVIFPWLPSPALFKRFYAGTRMYLIFQKIVKQRQQSGRREEDALQFLVDQGDDINKIIQVIVDWSGTGIDANTCALVCCWSIVRWSTEFGDKCCLGPLLSRHKSALA